MKSRNRPIGDKGHFWTRPHYEGNTNQCAVYQRGLTGFRFSRRRIDPAGIGYSVIPERDYESLETIPCPENWTPYVHL